MCVCLCVCTSHAPASSRPPLLSRSRSYFLFFLVVSRTCVFDCWAPLHRLLLKLHTLLPPAIQLWLGAPGGEGVRVCVCTFIPRAPRRPSLPISHRAALWISLSPTGIVERQRRCVVVATPRPVADAPLVHRSCGDALLLHRILPTSCLSLCVFHSRFFVYFTPSHAHPRACARAVVPPSPLDATPTASPASHVNTYTHPRTYEHRSPTRTQPQTHTQTQFRCGRGIKTPLYPPSEPFTLPPPA